MRAFDTSLFTGQIGADDHLVSSEKTVDRIIDFLHTRRNDKPFFIYMAPPVPHDPRICPKGFMDLYDPARMPTPVSFLPFHPFDNGEMTVRDELLAPHPRTEAVIRRHLADAYACITCLDHHIGRLLDVLKGMGELENTIVIFAADNGLSLGDHGLMGKQNLYEFGGMHVPLVMSGPGIPQGKSAAFVYLMDLFPTVCELTATPIPPLVEARSLAPILRGQASKIRDTAFTAYKDVQRAIRDERWKLIRYPQINRTQLFDLKADPHELNDLSSDPKHSDMVKEMLALLAKAQKEYGDTCPLSVVSPRDGRWSPDRRQEKPTRLPKTGTY
jgi:arylsulfatase A-like enzyme